MNDATRILGSEKRIYSVGEKGLMESLASSHTMRGVMGVVLVTTSSQALAGAVNQSQTMNAEEGVSHATVQGEAHTAQSVMEGQAVEHAPGEYTLFAAKQVGLDQKQNLSTVDYAQKKLLENPEVAHSVFIIDDAKYQEVHTFPDQLDLSTHESYHDTVKYDDDLIRQDLQDRGLNREGWSTLGGRSLDKAEDIAVDLQYRQYPSSYYPASAASASLDLKLNSCTIAPLLESSTLEQTLESNYASDGTVSFDIPEVVSQNYEKLVINEEIAHCQDMLLEAENLSKYENMGDGSELLQSIRLERYGQLKSVLEMARDFDDLESGAFLNNRSKLNALAPVNHSLDHDLGDLLDQVLPQIDEMMQDGSLQNMTFEERHEWTLSQVELSMQGMTPESVNYQQELLVQLNDKLEGMTFSEKYAQLQSLEVEPEIQEYVVRFNEGYDAIVVERQMNPELSRGEYRDEVREEYLDYLGRESGEREDDPAQVGHFYNKEYRNLSAEKEQRVDLTRSLDRDHEDYQTMRSSIFEISVKMKTLEEVYTGHMEKYPELTASSEVEMDVNMDMER